MENPKVVSHNEWIEARTAFLEKEKEFTRQRDALSKARRDLPWERVEKTYVFDGPAGKESLSDLFDGRSQLIVYHFMYGADWEAGCTSCSYLADHFDPAVVHLNHRDVTMVAASTAPLPVLEKFKARMGWTFKWLSAADSGFNHDYHVSFSQQEIDSGGAYYNYRPAAFPMTEAPGASVFYKDGDGAIFHTYSVYQRGLDMVPKGRDEDDLPFTMDWLRLHDAYED